MTSNASVRPADDETDQPERDAPLAGEPPPLAQPVSGPLLDRLDGYRVVDDDDPVLLIRDGGGHVAGGLPEPGAVIQVTGGDQVAHRAAPLYRAREPA